MKLLFLTHRVPYPPNRGDRIRAYHLLKFFSARHRVSLACLADEPVESSTESRLRELTERLAIVPQSSCGKWTQAALAFARGQTATSGMFASSRLKDAVRDWAKTEKFDAVIAFCSSMAPYAFLPELKNAPKFIDMVDVDSQKWLDYSCQARGMKRLLYGCEGKRLRTLESQFTENAVAVTFVSEAEAELFRSICPNDRTHAILNGVDLEYFRSTSSTDTETPFSCAFVGALDYGANIDALVWFCNHVWPEVKRREPRAALQLVGRCPTRTVQKLGDLPGVTIAASVPDVRPYLERSAVAIAPLRIARGIQNKVLEAMAMGKAVVASPGAMAGLEIEPGVQVVRAETPPEWIDALMRLWANPAERSRLGLQGRNYVESRHSWECTLAPWESLLEACWQHSGVACSKQGSAANSSRYSEAEVRIQEIPAEESPFAESGSGNVHPFKGHEKAQ